MSFLDEMSTPVLEVSPPRQPWLDIQVSKPFADYIDQAQQEVEKIIKRAYILSAILDHVIGHYGLNKSQVLSRQRTNDIAWARAVVAYIAEDLVPGVTHQEIGLFLDKQTSTITKAYKMVGDKLDVYPHLMDTIDQLKHEITERL